MSLVAIVGKTGSGKTAMLSHFCSQEITNGRLAWRQACREIDHLIANGYNSLQPPPQKHLCYADFNFRLNKRLQAYRVDGYRIGLENKFFKTQKFPVGSSFFLDEAQRYFDSRMSFYLREEVYRWFQLHRHNGYNVYMTAQRLANIDVNIRALFERIIVIDKLEIKNDKYGFISEMIWHCHEFTACDVAEKYQMACENGETLKIGTKTKIVSKTNVFRYYDSQSNKPVFYNVDFSPHNILEYDYFTEKGYAFTKEGMQDFNNKNYFVAPKGYYKKQ